MIRHEREDMETLHADDDDDGVDPYFKMCHVCKGNDFYFDRVEWERVCRDCATVGCMEFSTEITRASTKTYLRSSYFMNGVISKLLLNGLKLNGWELLHVEVHFKLCLRKFDQTRSRHKRRNFMNFNFVMDKICKHLGHDTHGSIKMPKLKSTLERLNYDWDHYVNPYE